MLVCSRPRQICAKFCACGEAYDKQAGAVSFDSRLASSISGKGHSTFTNEGLIALLPRSIWNDGPSYYVMWQLVCAKASLAAARAEIVASRFLSAPSSEFVVRGPGSAAGLLSRLAAERGINGGLPLSRYFPNRPNDFLVCVTETNTRSEIDTLLDGLANSAGS